MSFLVLSFFLSIIIGSLSVFFLPNLQFASSQTNVTSVSNLENISVKITSPPQNKQVPIGQLTVSGISSDNQEKNCIVFIDWNDLKPFQPVRAAGPGGIDDFSEWIYTFDSKYHEIVEGINELTSKITCLNENKPLTKWYSINVTGYALDGKSLPSLNNKTTELKSSNNPQIPLQTVMPSSNAKVDNISNMSTGENSALLGISNATDSEIEMIIPKEVINETLNNNTEPFLEQVQETTNTNFTSTNSSQLISPTPKIDLDEQSTTVPREQPPIMEQQQQPEQQLQPPQLKQQQQQQPEQPNSNNISNGSTGQTPQNEKSPTQGVFPPFKIPSLFP
ncbi:MAG TPA: hypothetical protein VFM31_06485 [Nitrososphaeraceae archaeon]|nr:hypothetical protein [Nitrososphaeraceae archaeon]